MSRTLYDCPRIGNRITATLFASQSLARAGFIAVGTVGALVGLELSGNPAWAATPAAVLQFGAAFAALAVAQIAPALSVKPENDNLLVQGSGGGPHIARMVIRAALLQG